MLVQLVCSVVDGFSIDERSFNLLKLELNTLNNMISLGWMSFSQIFFDNIVKINLERLMENFMDPWEDFIEQELIEGQ